MLSYVSIPVIFKGNYYSVKISIDAYMKGYGEHLSIRKNKNANTMYVCRFTGNGNKEYLHRLLMGLTKGDKKEIDHRNGNGLDNRPENMRICNHQENGHNRKKYIRKNNTSIYKGVSSNPKGKKEFPWRARICVDGKCVLIGCYRTEIEAYEAYCAKAKELHGEFANFG